MGASGITFTIKASDRAAVTEQLDEAIEQSRFEDGNSYSGCIGMVSGIAFRSHGGDRAAIEGKILDLAEKWGPAIVIRVGQTDEWVVGAWCSS